MAEVGGSTVASNCGRGTVLVLAWRIERILALLELIGRGRASGVEIARARARGANLFHICDGRVTRLVLYFDHEHAFADLGLRA